MFVSEGLWVQSTETDSETYMGSFIDKHGTARSTLLLTMEERLQLEYMKVKDAKELWEQLAVDYKAKVMRNACGIWTADTWTMSTDTRMRRRVR
jgi:hypothetical protein